MRKTNEIEIKEDVRIGDIILEKGDRIKVLENVQIDTIVVVNRNKDLGFKKYQWGKIVEKINSYLYEVYLYDYDDIVRLTEDDFFIPSDSDDISYLGKRPS